MGKIAEDASIGICTPGIIDTNSGLVKNSNTQCLIGMPLKNDIEKALGSQIVMENDANCFALAESLLGAAKGHDVVFGVIMGTGVGGGVVINGTLHKGKTNIAGEWGHHTLRPDGNELLLWESRDVFEDVYQRTCSRKALARTYWKERTIAINSTRSF